MMQYFMIEGQLGENPQISEALMNQHKAYTQKAMDAGRVLFAGLKKAMDGSLFVMKAESYREIEEYLQQEPFYKAGVQSYRVIEFDAHYTNELALQWFQ